MTRDPYPVSGGGQPHGYFHEKYVYSMDGTCLYYQSGKYLYSMPGNDTVAYQSGKYFYPLRVAATHFGTSAATERAS